MRIPLLVMRAVRLLPSVNAWIYDNKTSASNAFSNTFVFPFIRRQVSPTLMRADYSAKIGEFQYLESYDFWIYGSKIAIFSEKSAQIESIYVNFCHILSRKAQKQPMSHSQARSQMRHYNANNAADFAALFAIYL
jgi:hypothetical protein